MCFVCVCGVLTICCYTVGSYSAQKSLAAEQSAWALQRRRGGHKIGSSSESWVRITSPPKATSMRSLLKLTIRMQPCKSITDQNPLPCSGPRIARALQRRRGGPGVALRRSGQAGVRALTQPAPVSGALGCTGGARPSGSTLRPARSGTLGLRPRRRRRRRCPARTFRRRLTIWAATRRTRRCPAARIPR